MHTSRNTKMTVILPCAIPPVYGTTADSQTFEYLMMKRYTGQSVMAADLKEAVRWEEACRKAAVRGYCAGWDDAMKSREAWC